MQTDAANKPAQVSALIQRQLRSRNMNSVDPVTATSWLIEAGLQKEIGSRPGSYLRSLCRKGHITGAEKKGSNWQIQKVKVR
jgi:hypothetical protein